MSIRDHLDTLRWRAANGRTSLSNAWYRAAGRRIQGGRTGWRNWRNARARANGRAPRLDGAIAAVTSRMPVVRSRINPATGLPRRDDARLYRARSKDLARQQGRRAAEWDRLQRELARCGPGRELPAVSPGPARQRQSRPGRAQGRRGRN